MAVLLARMAGGGQLAGLAVRRGSAVMISEECHLNWHQRARKLHFGDNIAWLCRPFAGKPSLEEWSALVDALVEARQKQEVDLVVIDPPVNILPGRSENLAAGLLEVLLTLQRLTTLGVSVLILHHPRKGEVRAGQASRGSGALGGYADILLEMRWYGRPTDPDRRRVIEAYSRHAETPRPLVIELTAEGTDYLSHGDRQADDFAPNWKLLQTILAGAGLPLARAEVRRHWPRGHQKPDAVPVWRWLKRLVGKGLVMQAGSGRKNDPFRFRGYDRMLWIVG